MQIKNSQTKKHQTSVGQQKIAKVNAHVFFLFYLATAGQFYWNYSTLHLGPKNYLKVGIVVRKDFYRLNAAFSVTQPTPAKQRSLC